MSQAETNRSATPSSKRKSEFSSGRTALIPLCAVLFLATSVAGAFAQKNEPGTQMSAVVMLSAGSISEVTASTIAGAALPSIASIDAQTDVTVFLRSGVPADLQVAALRRTWTTDPAIRDFKGLEENDWDFTNLNSIAGFGELGTAVDIEIMVAQIFGGSTRVAALVPPQPGERIGRWSVAGIARRLILSTVQN